MKKTFSIITIALLFAIFFGTSLCFASTSAIVSGESVEVATGTTFEYRAFIFGNPGLTGIGLKLCFDTSVFTLAYNDDEIDCSQGNFFQNGMIVCGATNGGCQIVWTHTSDVASDGTLFTLKMSVKDTAMPGNYAVTIQNIAPYTVNKAEELVPILCAAGTITVREYQPLLYGEDVVVKRGESFDYAVLVRDNPGIAACDIIVRFDPETLALVQDASSGEYASKSGCGVTKGSLVSKAYTNAVEVFWNYAYGSTEEGALFVLHFQAKDYAAIGKNTIRIECVAENTENVSEQPVAFSVNNGSVQIESAMIANVDIITPHTIAISVWHTQAKNIVAAFYHPSGQLLALDIQTMSDNNASYSVQNDSIDFSKIVYKLMFLDEYYRPVCESYSEQ